MKVMLGALFAAGLCICAIGVSSASAMTLEECNAGGTATAVACPGGFWKSASGKNLATGGASTLGATVGGVEFIIQCQKVSGSGTSENVESGGSMHVKGTGIVVKFEECSVTKPAACTVPATIETKSLKGTTVTGTMSQKYEPTEGTTFVSFEVGGAACAAALKGVKSITGTTTASTTEAQEISGVQEFNVTKASGELKYAGQNAELKSSTTCKTENGTQVFARTP